MTNKAERSYSHWDGIVSTVSEFPLLHITKFRNPSRLCGIHY